MFGNGWLDSNPGESDRNYNCRGLVPRVLESIFNRLEEKASAAAAFDDDDSVSLVCSSIYSYSCKCSFYEIYQEKVFDLLDCENSLNISSGLLVRENAQQGVYVEMCTERILTSFADTKTVLLLGHQNRRVAETAMNRESSRSHAIFQILIEISDTNSCDGVIIKRSSKLTMVDLAGSERQKETLAVASRLKEASKINKSLSTLGRVINALVSASSSSGNSATQYVPYRDSKLTFLLRDSLGGNSKVNDAYYFATWCFKQKIISY